MDDDDAIEATVVDMGCGSTANEPLYFDIETIPDFARSYCFHAQRPEAVDRSDDSLMPPPDDICRMSIGQAKESLLNARPSDNYLSQVEQAERRTKSRAGFLQMLGSVKGALSSSENAETQWLKQLSTTPEYCSVVALGWQVGNGPTFSMVVGTDDDTEEDLLRQFWALAAVHSPLVGYNVLRFDLPVLMVRSALLKVAPSKQLNLSRWSNEVIDCYARRYPAGHRMGVDPGGLKSQCQCHGIAVPAGDFDGSKVWDTYQTDKEMIHTYVQSDVKVLADYYSRLLGLFW